MHESSDVSDPGWLGFDAVLRSMYPGGMKKMQHQSLMDADSPLVMLRKIHMRFLTTQALIAVIAVLLVAFGDLQGSTSRLLVVAGVVLSSLALAGISRAMDRALDCAKPLLAQYQTRFFKRAAYASAPEVVGFAGLVLTGDLFPFVLGFAFALVGHLYAAPSQANLQRDQEALNNAGCERSLMIEIHISFVDDEPQ